VKRRRKGKEGRGKEGRRKEEEDKKEKRNDDMITINIFSNVYQ
jgi:hypothetical protein